MGSAIVSFDVAQIRSLFPALQQTVNGHPLAYLDNAATTQKPLAVLDAERAFYSTLNANVHRGVHQLSQKATDAFEATRIKLAKLAGVPTPESLIWTKGCTEAVNLVAHSWGSTQLSEGDVILLSGMEHHANIVPWQLVAEKVGAVIKPIPISDEGELDLAALEELLRTHPVKLVGVKHVCNALGTINSIREVVQLAHAAGARVLVDGAQSLAHVPINVADLDVDFYTFSAHKAYGPTGVGALYGKKELLEQMPPYQGGGDMIRTVSWEKTTFNDLPNKFEPGTPNIAGVVAFGAAIDFLEETAVHLPDSGAHRHERDVLTYATAALEDIAGLQIKGTAKRKTAVISFVMEGVHPHDIGTILDQYGVAIRTGHHCCMPLMKRLGVPATARASLSLYTTKGDIDQLVGALRKVKEIFS